MPAANMNGIGIKTGAAGTPVAYPGNPSVGARILMDPLSGPKGSPLDKDNVGNCSTGALCTGIGYGGNNVIDNPNQASAPIDIFRAGFNDNDVPGTVPTYTAPPPNGVVASSTVNSAKMYIGGGRMTSSGGDTRGRPFVPSPYTAGVAFTSFGNGGSRDGSAGPAFRGFPELMVTATGSVANGAAVETGINNRSGVTITSGQSVFGSNTTVLAVPS